MAVRGIAKHVQVKKSEFREIRGVCQGTVTDCVVHPTIAVSDKPISCLGVVVAKASGVLAQASGSLICREGSLVSNHFLDSCALSCRLGVVKSLFIIYQWDRKSTLARAAIVVGVLDSIVVLDEVAKSFVVCKRIHLGA